MTPHALVVLKNDAAFVLPAEVFDDLAKKWRTFVDYAEGGGEINDPNPLPSFEAPTLGGGRCAFLLSDVLHMALYTAESIRSEMEVFGEIPEEPPKEPWRG